MQFIVKNLVVLILLCIPAILYAQTGNLPQGHMYEQLLNRLDIKATGETDLLLSSVKSVNRKRAVEAVMKIDSLSNIGAISLSSVDEAMIRSFYMNNREWYRGNEDDFASKKPVLKTFYKNKATFFEVDEKDFYLSVNPMLSFHQSKEADNSSNVFLNSRGIQLRGLIAQKVGFDATVIENQERGPLYFHNWITRHNAVPGVGFYKRFKNTAVDYFDARGSVHFTATRYIQLQFGYDKQFIGHGYRSLFLSDFANSYLFFKINTRIWKFNYTNLFMELTPQTIHINAGNKKLDNKYLAMHHLSLQATRWLNIGVFEAIAFGRKNHFEFSYLNPVIFLRAAEQQRGSGDNAMVGFDAKINIAKRVQLYGQLALDELVVREITGGNGWWANKFGLQGGAKYIDAFGIENLDLQAEINLVRPFTYSHYDSVANFTHYNQPLIHPLEANFAEAIAIVRYQPHYKWQFQAQAMLWHQGADMNPASNVGTNIFMLNDTRSLGDYGYRLPSGPVAKTFFANVYAAYMVRENVLLEAQGTFKKQKAPDNSTIDASVFSLGVRMNIFRRMYDF